jgi:imidazolonepropionase-like amidohydrolase
MKSLLKTTTLLALNLLAFTSTQLAAQTQVIHAGSVLAVPGTPLLSKQTIVVTDGKITALKPGFIPAKNIAKDAQFVDLSKSYVMPGLMDMHVHLQGELGPKNDSKKT